MLNQSRLGLCLRSSKKYREDDFPRVIFNLDSLCFCCNSLHVRYSYITFLLCVKAGRMIQKLRSSGDPYKELTKT